MNKCRLTIEDLTRRYATGEPIESLASDAGVSRVAIWKRLRAAGVPRGRKAGPVTVACSQCGRDATKPRWAALKPMQSFCSQACYWTWVRTHGPTYVKWRQGMRRARRVVASYVPIPPRGVVHHHDGDTRNNDVSNLALFATSAAHMSHHRGGNGTPIWDGRTITNPIEQPAIKTPRKREGPPMLTREQMLLEREIRRRVNR